MDSAVSVDGLFLNGIDGLTGGYLVDPLSATELTQLVDADAQNVTDQGGNIPGRLRARASTRTWSVPFDVKPEIVAQAGWAVVFHVDEDPAVRDAFKPLIAHRTERSNPDLVKVLEYAGESATDWLGQHRVALGGVVVKRVPLYLLLVGPPDRMPFEFGHLLDLDYCVGRLHFDEAAGYAAYIAALIDYETNATIPNRREIVFFGPRHANDPATWLSADQLVKPLACGTETAPPIVERVSKVAYTSRYCAPTASTKESLHGIFHRPAGEAPPAVVFTASHGIGWPLGDQRQPALQGALLCDDFAGPGLEPLLPSHYFAASDLEATARVHGTVCFHFACFGAGTPQRDRFFHRDGQPRQIAGAPFFSALPKALLGHSNGGALGVIGHIDRAWPSSIRTAEAGAQLACFENTLGNVLSGLPLGYCLNAFNSRYASLSTALATLLENRLMQIRVPEDTLWQRWTERNDAEAYVLFGDPAACVRTDALLD